MQNRDSVLTARAVAFDQLATLRINQSRGMSLKKAVKRKLVTISIDAETKLRTVIPNNLHMTPKGWKRV